MMLVQRLTKTDTVVLKGIAILAIALHNYFHILGRVRENEFTFDPDRFRGFLSALANHEESVQAIFSYLGHFGVQVFIFLSAYGLARQHWADSDWAAFVWSRVKKVYPRFASVAVAWTILASLQPGIEGPLEVLKLHGLNLALTSAAVSNLYPGLGLPPVGPWWFFPFIIQWYCMWPLVRRFAARFEARGLLGVAVASLLFTAVANPWMARWQINLLETPVGHMPELCFGIIAARYPVRISATAVICAGAVFVAANVFAPVWMLGFSSALVLIIAAYTRFRQAVSYAEPVLAYVGASAMDIFLINGIVRLPFLALAAERRAIGICLIGLASVACSVAIAKLLARRPAFPEAAPV